MFAILGHFLPFEPSDNPKNQNSKIEKKQQQQQKKKTPADIIILHICIINGNHMMYGS